VPIEQIKKTITPRYADNRKIEAMRYIGFLDRDGGNVKLGELGREYATTADPDARAKVVGKAMMGVPLYRTTLEWLHFGERESVNKPDLANYWHDSHADELGGASGDALTDAVILFMKLADMAGVVKFIPAGKGRETHIQLNRERLTAVATGASATSVDAQATASATPERQDEVPRRDEARPSLGLETALRVNVEIHIAADAKPATIEEIFKNMRRYLIERADQDDGASA
jgi:hypothetical protein